jgi:hypothetical protein
MGGPPSLRGLPNAVLLDSPELEELSEIDRRDAFKVSFVLAPCCLRAAANGPQEPPERRDLGASSTGYQLSPRSTDIVTDRAGTAPSTPLG